MEGESNPLLREIADLSRKNSALLIKIERMLFWQRIGRGIKWILIVALFAVGFLQLQPYLGTLYQIYGAGLNALPALQNLPQQLQELTK